jgi:hypothetical protein
MGHAGSAAMLLSRSSARESKQISRTPDGEAGRLTVYESARRPGSPRFIGPAPKKRGVVHRLAVWIRQLFT